MVISGIILRSSHILLITSYCYYSHFMVRKLRPREVKKSTLCPSFRSSPFKHCAVFPKALIISGRLFVLCYLTRSLGFASSRVALVFPSLSRPGQQHPTSCLGSEELGKQKSEADERGKHHAHYNTATHSRCGQWVPQRKKGQS